MKFEKNQFNVPILLIAFNRPNITTKVFQAIREIRPKKLFVSVDGPRNDTEKVKIEKVQKIVSNVDWLCKLKKKFNKKNFGCREAESSAINWFFDNVDEGIILEDDCLPNQDFFNFCKEILKKYRNDKRIMHISGNNLLGNWRRDRYSYYFSKYPFSWGWATWKRAWKKYDVDMKLYPEVKKKRYLDEIHPYFLERQGIKSLFEATYKGLDTWDYQWFFSNIIHSGLSVTPNKNLVQNIGFGKDSTHTKKEHSYLSIPTEKIKFPLKHPPFVIWDKESDKRYFRRFFWKRVRNTILTRTGLIKLFKFKE